MSAQCIARMDLPHSVYFAFARLSEMSALAAAMTRASSLVDTAVQQDQLAAALAQLSTAAARRDHELAQQVAAMGARLELLEVHAPRREQVVLLVSRPAEVECRLLEARLGELETRYCACIRPVTCTTCCSRTHPVADPGLGAMRHQPQK